MKALHKLLMLLAAAAMLAFSQNASAVTNLTLGDGHELGLVEPLGANPDFSDANKTTFLNDMIVLAVGSNFPVVIGGTPYTVNRNFNDFGTLPGPAVIGPSGTNTNITIGSGLYSYLFATYTINGLLTGRVWYIGNLSGDITIPQTQGGNDLTGWTLFGPGVPGVPDGGTTVMLLGAALGTLGMARRFLKI